MGGLAEDVNVVIDIEEPSDKADAAGAHGGNNHAVLGAFGLKLSGFQGVPMDSLQPSPQDPGDDAGARRHGLTEFRSAASDEGPPQWRGFVDAPHAAVVPLLSTVVSTTVSGRAIFAQLPPAWVELTGRSDAFGTRCLFSKRRHEHSVFESLGADGLLRVPRDAREWQPALAIENNAPRHPLQDDGQCWAVELHPASGAVRVLLRPGLLLQRMMQRTIALPTARFSWRVADNSDKAPPKPPAGSTAMGEFSVLSNLEDAAHMQPAHFLEFPLRREQLRSLGWMVSQERLRNEPFVTELREFAPHPDAPHWRLEGRLWCEYGGVKGGVLADAIGYGKTACTIGLVDCTAEEPLPQVPRPFLGFIPTKATLVLAPTNLHTQWLSEIKKFTGKTLKVLSVPTCAQLKRLPAHEIMEADIVVATYRIFYSAPYLHRLEEIVREERPGFAFPKCPQFNSAGSSGSATQRAATARLMAEWVRAYQEAFRLLPAWAARVQGLDKDPVTPLRQAAGRPTVDVTPAVEAEASQATQAEPVRRMRKKGQVEASQPPQEGAVEGEAKRRRVSGNAAEDPADGEADLVAPPEPGAGPGPLRAVQDWEMESEYVPLEAFWWKRVVCDEFHELLSRYPPAQAAVELFHADYKWGLSGTPPIETVGQVRKAAGFMGVQLPTDMGADDGGDAPRKVAQQWLDAFARRNTLELPPLREEENIVPVHLKAKERALYLALTQQQDQTLVDEPPELRAARHSASGLLKLCSHFCRSAAVDMLTAEGECERELAKRTEQSRVAERALRSVVERCVSMVRHVRHFEPHFCRAPDPGDHRHIGREIKGAVAARLKFLGLDTRGTKAELLARLFAALRSAETSEAAKEVALRMDFDPKSAGLAADLPAAAPPAWRAVEDPPGAGPAQAGQQDGAHERGLLARVLGEVLAKAGDPGAAPPRCAKLRANLGMPRYPCEADASVRREFEEATQEFFKDSDAVGKLRGVMAAWKDELERFTLRAAELERDATAKLESLQFFQRTLREADGDKDSTADPEPAGHASQFAKYGSKIEAIVTHVTKLQRDDPGCKIICFVQWEDLKRKISSALEEFEVEHVALQGSVWQRRAALTRFQYESGGPPLLLLSLEESASGTNLTAANHVIIVHPMEASTREEAVAFEMQAVGRVRRPGQERKIYIWRFVTIGTIEQQITEEHQRDLWERQQTAVWCSTQPGQGGEDAQPLVSDDDMGADCETVEQPAAEVASTQCYVDFERPAGGSPPEGGAGARLGAGSGEGAADEEDAPMFPATQQYMAGSAPAGAPCDADVDGAQLSPDF